MTTASPSATLAARNVPKSIFSVVLGFLTVVVLSLATDQILHVLQVYPPWGVPMYETHLNVLALTYRTIYTVFAGYLTARFAPRAPMWHVGVLGVVGLIGGTAGVVGTMGMDLGPRWYPILLAVLAFPSTWAGGLLHGTKQDGV
jgi:hypothetical protein